MSQLAIESDKDIILCNVRPTIDRRPKKFIAAINSW
jgi:hypothetical protein